MVILREFDGEQPEGYTLPSWLKITGFTERQIAITSRRGS